jgi:hypothetical protein
VPSRPITSCCGAGKDAVGAIGAGLHHENPAVREGCCRLLDHLVDTGSMGQLIAMADDPDAQVRTAAFHALACDRCKGDTCAPGAGEVLEPALRHLASDPDAHVRAMTAELAGKFVHTDGRAATALATARAHDPSPAGRKKAGWFTPGGTIYQRTAARAPNRTVGPRTGTHPQFASRRSGPSQTAE